MKSLIHIWIFILLVVFTQACGSYALQSVSQMNDRDTRFGESETVPKIPFGSPGDQVSVLKTPGTKHEIDLNSSNMSGPLVPFTIQDGFVISRGALLLCNTLLKSPCTHLRQQGEQPNSYPGTPISFRDDVKFNDPLIQFIEANNSIEVLWMALNDGQDVQIHVTALEEFPSQGEDLYKITKKFPLNAGMATIDVSEIPSDLYSIEIEGPHFTASRLIRVNSDSYCKLP